MWLPSKKQVDTATRYAGVVAATAITLLGLQAKGFDPQKIVALINELGTTVNTIVPMIGALYAGYLSIRGIIAASPANQISSVTEIANNPESPQSDTAKVALLNATASIISQPYAPGGVADSSQATKAALLDATAAMPEVVDPIHVTDQSLVEATVSNQVVKSEGVTS